MSVTTFGENIRPGQWQPYECIVRGINILPSVACCPWTKGHCISNQFNTRLTFTFLCYLNFASFIDGLLWYLSVGIWSYFADLCSYVAECTGRRRNRYFRLYLLSKVIHISQIIKNTFSDSEISLIFSPYFFADHLWSLSVGMWLGALVGGNCQLTAE